MKVQLLVCGCLLAFCCNALGQKFQPDIGPSVHEFGRRSTGYVEPLPLGDTVYQATLLVSHYTDKPDQKPDFVSIEVQKKHDHGYMVYFERQFPANEVPANILTAKTKDVATFDQKRGIVRFQIGPKTFQYTLPSAIATSRLSVQWVNTFALGGVDETGVTSDGEKALRAVLAEPNAANTLEGLFSDATDAGRLYILAGLRLRDPDAYHRVLSRCGGHDSMIETMRGCAVDRESFASLVRQIDNGAFDLFLKESQ